MFENEIIEKIRNNEYQSKEAYPERRGYREDHVFDENKSVKWNKEEVVRQNEKIKAQMDAYNKSKSEAQQEFKNDVESYILNNHNIKDNKDIAEEIYNKAYSDGHSGGLHEILNYADEIASFAETIIGKLK